MGNVGTNPVYVPPAMEYISVADALLATKGDNVVVGLPTDLDLKELDEAFYRSGGKLSLIDWRAGFPTV